MEISTLQNTSNQSSIIISRFLSSVITFSIFIKTSRNAWQYFTYDGYGFCFQSDLYNVLILADVLNPHHLSHHDLAFLFCFLFRFVSNSDHLFAFFTAALETLLEKLFHSIQSICCVLLLLISIHCQCALSKCFHNLQLQISKVFQQTFPQKKKTLF